MKDTNFSLPTTEISFERGLFPELEIEPGRQKYGPDWSIKNPFADLRAYVSDQPVAFSLVAFYRLFGLEVPKILRAYTRRFDLWLVPNRFYVRKGGGVAEPVSVGIEVEYRNDDKDLNPGMTMHAVSLLPGPRFIERGVLAGEVSGEFGATGELNLETGGPGLSEAHALSPSFKVGVKEKAGAKLKVGLSFNFTVSVPLVSAVGEGGSRVEWEFKEESTNLYDRTIETWTVLALPKGLEAITYRTKLNIKLRTAFFPTKHETGWKELTCLLVKPPRPAKDKPERAT